MSELKRCVEMPEAIPLVGDPVRVDLPIRSAHEAPEGAVVARVGTVESLFLDTPNPRAEAPAEHRERGEIDLGVAVGVRVVFLELEEGAVQAEPPQGFRRTRLTRTPCSRGVEAGDRSSRCRPVDEPIRWRATVMTREDDSGAGSMFVTSMAPARLQRWASWSARVVEPIGGSTAAIRVH